MAGTTMTRFDPSTVRCKYEVQTAGRSVGWSVCVGPGILFWPRVAGLWLSLVLALPANAGSDPGAATGVADSISVVPLAELVAEATAGHPAIRSARASADAAAERPSQVGALPDPVIGIEASNFRLDDPTLGSSPMSGVVFRVRQGIPFPGKLSRRKGRAVAEAKVWAEIADAVASDVTVQVKSRYWALSGAAAVQRITRENVAVLEELIDVANTRFAVGMGAQQDVLQLQATLAELSAQLVQREQETRTAERGLKVAVGREADGPAIRAARFRDFYTADLGGGLVQDAQQFNPRLTVQVARVLAAERSLDEAQRDRLPDFGLGAGYRLRQPIDDGISDGGDMFFVALEMSLPLYAGAKQNRRIAETRSRLAAAHYS